MARPETEILKNWKVQEPPLVSVACVTYNHEPYIRDAIEGFLLQETDFPFEIIIGEDCSTDGTMKVVDEYKKKYPRIIKVLDANQNLGAVKNFWRTLYAAKGKFIAYCEGDDYWLHSQKMQTQLNAMLCYPEFNLSFHPAIVKFADESNPDRVICNWETSGKKVSVDEVIMGGGAFMPSASIVFKKEILTKVPDWFLICPVGDYPLQILGSLDQGALYLPTPMAVYRKMTPGSWSERMGSENLIEYFKKYSPFWAKLRKDLPRHKLAINRSISDQWLSLSSQLVRKYRFSDSFQCLLASAKNPRAFVSCIFSRLYRRIYLTHRKITSDISLF